MRAYVLPPDGPGHTAEWTADSQLLRLLYREIGVDCVDSLNLATPVGTVSVWVDDAGLLADPIVYNDRAIAFCRAMGTNVAALAGIAVITGGPTPDGGTPGLTDEQLVYLSVLLSPDASEVT